MRSNSLLRLVDSHVLVPASRGFMEHAQMRDRPVTPDMVPVIKLARGLDYNYARIASYFQINQGRIADVMKGRKFPDIPPAADLPVDFPPA